MFMMVSDETRDWIILLYFDKMYILVPRRTLLRSDKKENLHILYVPGENDILRLKSNSLDLNIRNRERYIAIAYEFRCLTHLFKFVVLGFIAFCHLYNVLAWRP
ncbi:hypothetical protein AMTRI_Chr11g152210 [Amborella trichopoda]